MAHAVPPSLANRRRGPMPGLLAASFAGCTAGRPAWWFHPLGIEAKRAQALRAVAKHAEKLWAWAELSIAEAEAKLALLPGVGPWTIGSVMSSAMGDPDAVAVGDFHLKNLVSYALAGEPRATDDAHAGAAVAVRRPARQGCAVAAARRPFATGLRAPPTNPADRTVVIGRLC